MRTTTTDDRTAPRRRPDGTDDASVEAAGHDALADEAQESLVGRNVLEGRWTFQIVEEFDDTYWECLREFDRRVREELTGGLRHVYEAELKEQRRTRGRRHHEGRPAAQA